MTEYENEVVEETVEDVETTEEMPSEVEETESTEETQVEDFSEADQAFLNRFKIPFDKKNGEQQYKTFESVEQLMEAAEMGSALPRYKERLAEAENKNNSAHYKWVDEYMKAKGYSDGTEFVKAIKVNEKMSQLMQKGMSEQDALAEATEYVNSTFGNQTDKRTKELESFLGWHQSKVDAGKFSGKLDIDSIPQQVIDAYERGESLREAYMDYMLDDITVKTEQETLKKLAKNKETSTGGLKPGATPEATMTPEQIVEKLSNMSSKDRMKWIEKNEKMIEKSGYFR